MTGSGETKTSKNEDTTVINWVFQNLILNLLVVIVHLYYDIYDRLIRPKKHNKITNLYGFFSDAVILDQNIIIFNKSIC